MGILFKKYLWVVYLFFLFLGTYFVAKTISTFIASKLRVEKNIDTSSVQIVSGPSRQVITFDDYKVILERNIFDSRELEMALPTETMPTQVDLNAPPVKTSLPIKLISTFVVGAGTDSRSMATVVGGGGGQPDVYSVGDEKSFAPGVKITRILPSRVEFSNGPRMEYAEIEDFGGGVTTGRPASALEPAAPPGTAPGGEGVQQTAQGKFVVEKAELDQALANVDQLFTQIRAVPQMGPTGKAAGLKLLSIRGGSFFAKLGLKRNDVLERINGQEMDMKRGVEIFNQLKDSNHISIDLVRNGQKTTLEYDIQ
jgi:type II secretion system protein C